MTERKGNARRARTGHGVRMAIVLLAAAGLCVLRFADVPAARVARDKIGQLVMGNKTLSGVIEVFGGAQSSAETPAAAPAAASAAAGKDETVYAASSGNADDILQRGDTLFPDTVDQTVYPMEFDHQQPTAGTVTSTFGARISPTTGEPGFHYGVDIAADEGVPIGAFADGKVREVGESSYGKYLIVDHADGFATLYAHCSSISAAVGDAVTCGQEIARVGQTGNATGPHLHLELWREGSALDPAQYLTAL